MKKLIIDAAGCNKDRNFSYYTYLTDLLNYFYLHREEIKFDKIIVACNEIYKDCFLQLSDKFEVIGLNCSNHISRYLRQRKYYEIFSLNPEDLVLWPGGYSALNKHCHHVLVMHDLLYLRPEFTKSISKAWKWHHKYFFPRSVKIADKVISITQWVKDDMVEKLHVSNPDKIVPIYNYSDFGKYNYASGDRDAINRRGDNGLEIPKNYFLVVSQDYIHKNVITAIMAFEKYASLHPEGKLVLVCKLTNERKKYIELLPENIKKRILIYRGISNDDLSKLYRCAEAFIMPTMFEGMGVPLVEAMYHGARVVSSNIPVAVEVTGGKAIYFNPRNVGELVNILENIKSYPFPQDQRTEIEVKFGPKNTCGRYIEVINSFA